MSLPDIVPGDSTLPAVRHYQFAGTPVAATNDVQTVTVSGAPTNATLTFTNLPQNQSYTAATDITPEALDDALSTLLGDAAAVEVTGTYSAGAGGTYIFTWGGTFAGQPIPVIAVTGVFVGGTTPAVANVHTTPGVSATFAKIADVGALLVDVTGTQLYINTGTKNVPVWAQIAHA